MTITRKFKIPRKTKKIIFGETYICHHFLSRRQTKASNKRIKKYRKYINTNY